MQVTSLISQTEGHEHGDGCGCGHDHEHSVVHLWQTIAGVVFVLNAYVVDWLFQQGTTVASASAMIGAIILGYPIIVTAIKDLRRGRLSINELVAIAVLAAFASEDYKTAGIVAFFMLTGEIIESCNDRRRAQLRSNRSSNLRPPRRAASRKTAARKKLPRADLPLATSSASALATTWRRTV